MLNNFQLQQVQSTFTNFPLMGTLTRNGLVKSLVQLSNTDLIWCIFKYMAILDDTFTSKLALLCVCNRKEITLVI